VLADPVLGYDGGVHESRAPAGARDAAADAAGALWNALRAATGSAPGGDAASVLYALVHGVWGLAPPAPLREGGEEAAAAVAAAAPLAPVIAARAAARLEALRAYRDAVLERHVALAALLFRAREVRELTSFMPGEQEQEAAGGAPEEQQQQQEEQVAVGVGEGAHLIGDAGGGGGGGAQAQADGGIALMDGAIEL
jgi:hypothetical protein